METLNELRLMGAWERMSAEFPWNEEQLERYKNNVDWSLVSENENVAWSLSLLERFKDRLNWKELSKNDNSHLFRPEIIRAFADRWDWTELSEKPGWTLSLVEEFKDRIDWGALTENDRLDDESLFGEAFLVKYFDHIRFSEFEFEKRRCKRVCYSSDLWGSLCNETFRKLSDEVSGLTKR